MGTIYRVTVVAETTDAGGGHVGSETLFELAGRADMVARTAPAALADALTVDAGLPERPIAERVMDDAMATVNGAERPRRPRRTKAQIAADEAVANGAGLPVAAPVPVVQGAPDGTPPESTAPLPNPPYNPFAAPGA